MDNLTHTLIGTLLGETIARSTRSDASGLPADARRNLLVAMAAIGSNLPDSDLLYSFVGSKVNYLLHHRGHTHTIVGALALAGLAFLVSRAWLKRREAPVSSRDLAWLAGMLSGTSLLHVAMDFTNNYGVHPFWPFHNSWLYGDAVFIAEPLFWAACAPLVFMLRTWIARTIVAGILALGMGLAYFSGLVPPLAAGALAAVTLGMLLLGRRASPQASLRTGVALWLLITATFAGTSTVAARRADRLAGQQFPQALLLDRVLTPMPANPLCWEVIFVQTQDAALVARRAIVALAPVLIPADRCLSRNLDGASTAPLQQVAAANTPALKWYGEIATPTRELAALAANCEAAAALRFIRVPWIATVQNARVLGDLRYDREQALGFAELVLQDPPVRCPKLVPPWRPPRADSLD